jgi:hypothetical protein
MTSTIMTYRADPELAELLERAARGALRLRIDTDDESHDIYVTDLSVTKKRATSQEDFEQRRGIFDGVDVDELIKEMKANR